jgi:7-carboxy-7-deazaguanine synthase
VLNTQPIEKSSRVSGPVDVVNIWKTIQGEGLFVGETAVFVRLAGCNLQCPACDTDYTSYRKMMEPRQVLNAVNTFKGKASLVVITGGEPFRQQLVPLLEVLLDANLRVQIETNGTIFNEQLPMIATKDDVLSVICSPKTALVSQRLVPWITAYKYVVRHMEVSEEDGLPLTTLGNNCLVARPAKDVPIYVQPLDEQNEQLNKLNTAEAVRSCMQFGYRLCLQTHKIVGLE